MLRALEQLPLEPHQRPRREPPLAAPCLEFHDLGTLEEDVRLAFECRNRRARARDVAQCLQQVSPRERGALVREPIRAFQSHRDDLRQLLRVPPIGDDAKHPPQAAVVEAVLGRPGSPLGPQPSHWDPVVLAAPRLERRHLGRARRALASSRHVLDDLRTALGEVLDHPARHAVDLGAAALDGVPPHLQALSELVAQDRLVEVARGLRMSVEQATVQRGPPPIGALGRVRDHDMRMQQRVAGARGPVPERCGDEPATGDARRSAMAATPLAASRSR